MSRSRHACTAAPISLVILIAAGASPSQPPSEPQPDPAVAAAGISDADIEIYTTYAYTWPRDPNTRTIECVGDFQLRMGGYSLAGRDAVIWFSRPTLAERPYYDLEVFLWRTAEIRHPGGTVESGDALLVSLRSFGSLVLNTDAHADQPDAESDLYQAALRARQGVDRSIPPPPDAADSPLVPRRRLTLASQPPAPRPPVSYSSRQLISEFRDGRRVVVALGDVLVTQGSDRNADSLELRADNAVLYLHQDLSTDSQPIAPIPAATPTPAATPLPPLSKGGPAGVDDKSAAPTPPPGPEELEPRRRPTDLARAYVDAVYLEGDVVLTRGSRMIRASQIYYDFQSDRAIILDAVMRAVEPRSNVPIYLRAQRVRQLSSTEFSANNAVLSASEFHTPHVALGAASVKLVDRTPRNEAGDVIGIEAGSYQALHTTLNLEGLPVAYWPFSRGEFSADRSAFRSARFGYSDEFGATFETRWYFFNLLGLEPPPGVDATYKLDYLTQRGPATGIDLDYLRDDSFGLLRSYYIRDDDQDDLGGNPRRGGVPDTDDRGRILWRHRQFLQKGWELTLESSYISDDQYLEQYERNEFENAKDQETTAYLLNRDANWQFSSLFNATANDFITLAEHYPDLRFSLLGQPLGDALSFYHDSRAGLVRFNRANDDIEALLPRRLRSTDETVRGDAREELTLNLGELGPLKVLPFGSIRGSAWDGTPDPERGAAGRLFGTYGLRASMVLHRVFDNVSSRLLDLHRLRHILKPEVAFWNAHSNIDGNRLSPFDPDVESIDDFGGAVVGLRQRWQTYRGPPGNRRSVDWITLDLESGFFRNPRPADNTHGNFIPHRPEDSISSNFFSADFQYRLSDSTALIYDGVYDWNRGNVGTSNVSLAFERLPRISSFLGWRYIHDTNSNLLGLGSNYKLNEKHTVGVREFYDIDLGRNAQTQLIYVRRWPRWYTAVSVEWDRTIDDFSVNLSIWPEGAPNLALGNRRFTQMGETVGLRP